LICQLPVTVPFCCYTHLLHRQICWLLTLAQILSLALFSLFPPLGPNDEGHSKKLLLLFHRRRLLLNFWLHSSVVYMSAGFHLSSVRTIWLPPEMLVAYMLSENFLWIDSLTPPNFRWNRWVRYLTKTALHRWGVTANFAWLLLLFLRVSVLLAGNLTAIE
jgi:hypothetical protein